MSNFHSVLIDILKTYDQDGFPREDQVNDFNKRLYARNGVREPLSAEFRQMRRLLVHGIQSCCAPKWIRDANQMDLFMRVAQSYWKLCSSSWSQTVTDPECQVNKTLMVFTAEQQHTVIKKEEASDIGKELTNTDKSPGKARNAAVDLRDSRLQTLEADFAAIRVEKDLLVQEKEKLKTEEANFEEKERQLSDLLATEREAVSSLQKERDMLKDEAGKMEEEKKRLVDEIVRLEERVSETQGRLDRLGGEKRLLEESHKIDEVVTKQQLSKLLEEVKRLEAEGEEHRKEHLQMEAYSKAYNELMLAYNQLKEMCQKHKDQFESQVEEVQEALDAKEDEFCRKVRQLETENRDMRAKIDQVVTEKNDALYWSCQVLEMEDLPLQELEKTQEKNRELEAENLELKTRLNCQEQQQQMIQTLQKQVSSLEYTLEMQKTLLEKESRKQSFQW